jgi:hypothetical protein
MSTFKIAGIPPEILALINNPPLLKGESSQEYYDLLSVLVSNIAPADIVEWLWLIQFNDCTWEIFRNRRFRTFVIDLQRGPALQGLILKMAPSGSMLPTEFNKLVARWTENPEYFSKHGIVPQSVLATAFVQAAARLELIDKSLERLHRRCDTILQQLEYRREVFAHRARRAADKVLKAENVEAPNIVPAAAPLAIEPPDQARPDQSCAASNEIAIVQASSESDMPDSDGTSPEVSKATPSSDL